MVGLSLGLGLGLTARGASFVPTDIANIALWIDTSDLTTITHVLNAVSQIDDKSGLGNHMVQGTAVNQPTTGSAINSLNAFSWDGSSDFMDFTSAISRTSGYTVFSIVNVTDDSLNKAIFSGTAGSFAFRADATEQLDIVRTDQAVVLGGTVTIPAATDAIVSCRTGSAGNNTQVDGVTADSNATDPVYSTDTDRWGAQSGTTQFFFDGLMGEQIVYTRILTNAEMNQVGTYLAAKWGITWTDL